MKRLVIIGAGELGQQIAHFVTVDQQFNFIGYVDDWQEKGTIINGKPVLGSINNLSKLYSDGAFDEVLIGVGYKHLKFRKALYDRFYGEIPFATFIHSSCYVDPTAEIGEGAVIYPKCIIDKNTHIKNNVLLNWGTGIGHDSILEEHSFFAPRATLAGCTKIGEMCFIGAGAVIIDHISIANSTLIGGGAIVVENITKPQGIYVGNPARFLKKII